MKELKPVLEELGVNDISLFSKNQWAKFAKEKINEKNKREVIKMSEKCKYKVSSQALTQDSFKMKTYFEELSLHEARYKFRIISHSMPLAMNMRREKRFRERGWICLGCNGQPPPTLTDHKRGAPHPSTLPPPSQPSGEPAYETEGHVMNCWAYSDIITGHGLDMSRDRDMIKFFTLVMERRAEAL